MKIIEYEKHYLEDVKDLMVELEEYLSSIDKDMLDRVHPDYREIAILLALQNMKKNNGKCYLAIDNNKAVGMIIGTIPKYDKYDYLDYKCPKRGVIEEFIITKKIRNCGIGKILIDKMEDYFISQECQYILVDAFAYNEIGINFYNKYNFHNRMYTMIKKIKEEEYDNRKIKEE